MVNELDALLMSVPAPLNDRNIIYWDDFCQTPPQMPLVVYGAGNEGVNIAVHIRRAVATPLCFIDRNPPSETLLNIPVLTAQEAAARFGTDVMPIVAVGAYIYDNQVYADIRRTLADAGFTSPYYIHDFSYGYALGAEHILSKSTAIRESFSLLTDDISRRVFLDMLKNAMTHFGRHMSFLPEKLGDEMDAFARPFDVNHSSALYCSTNDFDAADPDLTTLEGVQETIYLFPFQPYRYKLKESLYKKYGLTGPFIVLNDVLSDCDGDVTVEKTEFMGGTPLRPARKDLTCHGITADALAQEYGKRIGIIKLDMRGGYQTAIEGAHTLIATQKPVIAVNGFAQVNHLWETLYDLSRRLSDYKLFLRRYAHINPIAGHTVYAVHKEAVCNG